LETLAAPDPGLWSWQVPVSRLVELETYTRLLALIGRADDNVELYKMLLALEPGEGQEQRTRVSLAYQLARRGSTAEALMHLHRALEITPEDTRVQQLIERLGG